VKKIFSLFKQRVHPAKFASQLFNRINLPSFTKIRFIIRTLNIKEKAAFAFFVLLFFTGIIGLSMIINDRIAVETPVDGGVLYEGVIGFPHFINPLIAVSEADHDLTKLIYAGLLKSDGQGGLKSELAEKYEISEDNLTYTFFLKENLRWSDGQPITAQDIIFTVKLAQDPLAKSPKRANWEGVETEIINSRAVKFILKKPYAPFLENTTLEILPYHLWADLKPEQISLSQFNIEPIGAGPYRVKKISRNSSGIINSYTLESFEDYALKKPYLKKIIFKFYNSEADLLTAYENRIIDSIGAISSQKISDILRKESRLQTMTLSRVFGVFLNQNKNKILADAAVRKILKLAVDKRKIIEEALAGYGSAIDHPIPPDTLGFIKEENNNEYDPEQAKILLEKSGWKLNEKSGIMEKKIKKETILLTLSLSTSMAPELVKTAELLKTMWEDIGVKTDVKIFEIGDFEKNIIRPRDYDALLFGEITGFDPDPFAFWHSSQRNDPGLNIALYANIAADDLLEKARSIADPAKRAKNYVAFQKEVQKDIPAIFLYTPHYLYILPERLKSINISHITVPSDRFAQVNEWYIDTKKVWKFLAD
jgi:peptide/nickel transport system substrate-binding protein